MADKASLQFVALAKEVSARADLRLFGIHPDGPVPHPPIQKPLRHRLLEKFSL